MSELKPCPFCGGEAAMQAPNMHRKTCVVCKECGVSTGWGTVDTITSVWNRRAQPANEPLTMEQLRNMDGEPVWLKDGIGEGWFLASAIVGEKIYFCEKSITVGEPITGCGKTWLAYRRPPEGSENDGQTI